MLSRKQGSGLEEVAVADSLAKYRQEASNDSLITKYTKDYIDSQLQAMQFVENLAGDDGSVYRGYLREGLKHGAGVMVWADSSVYEGEWRDNQRHGKGKLMMADGFVYEGLWARDMRNGTGVAIRFDKSTYKGEWKDDL